MKISHQTGFLMETSPVSAKRPPDCKRYRYDSSDGRTSELSYEVQILTPPEGPHECWGWRNRSMQSESRIVSACGPLEDKVGPTEQRCSLLVKMLITPGDRWRSDYSSNEHVPGKLSDWFLPEKGRFRATGRVNEAIFVVLWSISTVRSILLLQGDRQQIRHWLMNLPSFGHIDIFFVTFCLNVSFYVVFLQTCFVIHGG